MVPLLFCRSPAARTAPCPALDSPLRANVCVRERLDWRRTWCSLRCLYSYEAGYGYVYKSSES